MASSHARRGSDISLVARLGECRATSGTKNHGLVWLCLILSAGQVLQWLSARDGAQDRDQEDRAEGCQQDAAEIEAGHVPAEQNRTDRATDDRAENTQDDIAQQTTATTHDQACQPAGDQAEHDPGDETHWFASELDLALIGPNHASGARERVPWPEGPSSAPAVVPAGWFGSHLAACRARDTTRLRAVGPPAAIERLDCRGPAAVGRLGALRRQPGRAVRRLDPGRRDADDPVPRDVSAGIPSHPNRPRECDRQRLGRRADRRTDDRVPIEPRSEPEQLPCLRDGPGAAHRLVVSADN